MRTRGPLPQEIEDIRTARLNARPEDSKPHIILRDGRWYVWSKYAIWGGKTRNRAWAAYQRDKEESAWGKA